MTGRLSYATLRLAEALLSALSRFVNAAFLGGSTSISVSARAALETGPRWRATRRLLDTLFFFDPDHCARSLHREAMMARRTLAQIAALKET